MSAQRSGKIEHPHPQYKKGTRRCLFLQLENYSAAAAAIAGTAGTMFA